MTSNDDVAAEVLPSSEKKVREDSVARYVRLQKEAKELRDAVDSGDVSALKNRVAAILNLYPHTRNSDVSLALKYWEEFQPDIYNTAGIIPKDLFRLERVPNIVRVRQKIQNEYMLFVADEGVRRRRKGREEEVKESIVEDAPPRKYVTVFSDETGKTDTHAIVAAVWVLTGRAIYSVSRAIDTWKLNSGWGDRELHFKRFRGDDVAKLVQYLDIIRDNREFLSFKLISVDQSKTSRSIVEIVRRLHEYMIIRGAQHEIESKRIALPYEIGLTVDEEQSLDEIALADIQARVSNEFKAQYGEQLVLRLVRAARSQQSQMIQLADVIAGAANRRLNYKGERKDKDDIADLIIEKLELSIERGEDVVDGDASTFLSPSHYDVE